MQNINRNNLLIEEEKNNLLTERQINVFGMLCIYYPEIIIQNDLAVFAINYINNLLQNTEDSLPDSDEKFLCRYNLLFFHLKLKNIDEARSAFRELLVFAKEYFHYNNPTKRNFVNSFKDYFEDVLNDKENDNRNKYVRDTFIKTVSLLLDSRELTLLGDGFNLSHFPLPPRRIIKKNISLSKMEALSLLNKNQLDKAREIYNYMRIFWYEIHTTLVHLARLEMAGDNVEKAELQINMAWRLRSSSPKYVLNRIIFFIIFLRMLKSEPFDIWLSVFKQSISQDNDVMFWEMDFILRKYNSALGKKNAQLLKFLLSIISDGTMSNQSELIQLWNNIEPLSEQYWPDYK